MLAGVIFFLGFWSFFFYFGCVIFGWLFSVGHRKCVRTVPITNRDTMNPNAAAPRYMRKRVGVISLRFSVVSDIVPYRF